MLKVENISFSYSSEPVLNGISLVAEPGKITVVIGPNGCGKSTLLKAICGILPVASGSIRFDSDDLLNLSAKERAQRVAYLSQSRAVPDITVERLILHGRFPYQGYPRKYTNEDHSIAEKAMNATGIIQYKDRALSTLSGGTRQKAYIAMALAQDTPVLLLDEPTTYLDINNQLMLLNTIKALSSSGKHIVMVIHDISQALQFADKVIVMDRGTVAATGNSAEICSSDVLQSVFHVGFIAIETKYGTRYIYENAPGK